MSAKLEGQLTSSFVTPEIFESRIAGGAGRANERRTVGHGTARGIYGCVACSVIVIVLAVLVGCIESDRAALLDFTCWARWSG